MSDERNPKIEPYKGPAGGWGSVKSVARILKREQVPIPSTVRELWRQNKPRGFTCVSCAWPQPEHPMKFEFCENGAKASAWELTSLRVTPEFFAQHTCSELASWSDHDLEQQGRLTHPMRYDRASDKYVPCEWNEAFAAIGAELKQLDPKSVVFYASGRASLETSYLYALFARLYGHNNLPDSSNMCHEATGVALRQCLGSRGEARRADHRVQPGARARAGALHQSAKPGGDAHRQRDAAGHAIPPGQDWRRHRGDHRPLQGPARAG
jgi:anaerobic selenocysteine-containing dehydrogenase